VGAVLQGVRPTMIILAVYFTVADVVLLAQWFFYRGFAWKDDGAVPPVPPTLRPTEREESNETTTLLDGPMVANQRQTPDNHHNETYVFEESANPTAHTLLPMHLKNAAIIIAVCATGMVIWSSSNQSTSHNPTHPAPVREIPAFDVWGQIFGWLCAVFYFGSRFPQLILNWRRKSVEGLSVLFFLFACLGNSTFVLFILAFDATGAVSNRCLESCGAREVYGRHILVNLPWLVDGVGTMLLDVAIFAQFLHYGEVKPIRDEV
jgi:uncharacterized protein with PQ loop repeat